MQPTAPCVHDSLSRCFFVSNNRSNWYRLPQAQSAHVDVQCCSSSPPVLPYHACLPLSRPRRSRPRALQCQASLLDALAFVPGVCFDRQCQEAADRAFLVVTAVPLLGLLVAIVLRFRPATTEQLGSEQVATFKTAPCDSQAVRKLLICCLEDFHANSFS